MHTTFARVTHNRLPTIFLDGLRFHTAAAVCQATAKVPVHPDGNVCYRGGGFDNAHQAFFTKGRRFRQPAYLATSFSGESTAAS